MGEKLKKIWGFKKFTENLGPGLVTGAADDDPSGIATYSIAGAQLGTSLLWMSIFTFPLMAAMQMMCARIGMVTGRGLAGALNQKFPKYILAIMSVLLLAANTVNIAADLAGMADAAEILTGINSPIFVVIFGVTISYIVVKFRYQQIARTLKWLAFTLCAYIITAFLIKPDWHAVGHSLIHIEWPKDNLAWQTIVAILGTTISPYLFFWQSSQEVEEERSMGRTRLESRKGASKEELSNRLSDVISGGLLSNIVMFFIILTTALTLHVHGITNITSSKEAAAALRPLAGNLATLLYTVGIVSVGFLAIPTLAGSSAYALAETFYWKQGLDEKMKNAQIFYMIIIVSVICGMLLNFIGVNPIKALFWSAIINGILAPFILTGVLLVASDKKLMEGQPSGMAARILMIFTIIVMFAAAIGMIFI